MRLWASYYVIRAIEANKSLLLIIDLFETLTPRLQELLFESKKFKDANGYKY